MIHINLLPQKRGRVSKKTIELRNFLILTGMGVGAVLVVAFVVAGILGTRVSSLTSQRDTMSAEIARLKKESAQIANFEEDKKRFEEKIEVIRQLRRHQTRPVRFLDQIAHHMPNRVWLTELSDQGGMVTVKGLAMSNNDVVEMIRDLKQVEMLSNVQVTESKRTSGDGISTYEFTMTARLTEPAGK
ncbi:MAG: PilN domain-containing protein [Nitrospirota bacterium]|nr:PilN domain-containing protein [Nitrospirota bacterium]